MSFKMVGRHQQQYLLHESFSKILYRLVLSLFFFSIVRSTSDSPFALSVDRSCLQFCACSLSDIESLFDEILQAALVVLLLSRMLFLKGRGYPEESEPLSPFPKAL
jgi:hypothetical protein